MKMLKKWIAFCLVILLLAGVAFDKGALVFNQVEAAEIEGSEQAGSAEASTEEPADSQQTEEEASGAKILDEQPAEQPAAQQPDNTAEVTEPAETAETEDPAPAPEQQTEEETVNTVETDAGQPAAETPEEPDESVPETEKTEQKTESQGTPAAEPEAKKQDAMELKQEIRDEYGNVLLTVTAEIKESTFDADTSEVTMKVSTVDSGTEKAIEKLAGQELEENQVLGDYFLYNVEFQVNGKTTEPGKEIKITFEPDDFLIKDTEKAAVFYYNEAGSPAGNEKAEIVEIIQKSELVDRLQAAGKSTAGVDDDYDLTEITLSKDGKADKIITEGRRSTIYGCYVEKDKATDQNNSNLNADRRTLYFENEELTVSVTEADKGAIPSGAILQVIPILENEKDTASQYDEVEKQVARKAEENGEKVKGFLAYDICLVDKTGEKIEPAGKVELTLEYKEAAIPECRTTNETEDASVRILHLEEDEKGNVKQVVDLEEEDQLTELQITSMNKIEKAEAQVDSFSPYVIAWLTGKGYDLTTLDKPEIVDNIIKNGQIELGIPDELQTVIDQAKADGLNVRYEWYKTINDGQEELVTRKSYNGEYNLSEDNDWVNIALDEGVLNGDKDITKVEYQVKVIFEGEGDSQAIESEPYSVPYYNELRNGSFEFPEMGPAEMVKNQHQDTYPEGFVWKTTASDKNIELVHVVNGRVSPPYDWVGTAWAPDGDQFAELNASSYGALYQDVSTIKGETLNYWFSHRARGKNRNYRAEYDSMYVVIVPADIAMNGINGDGNPIDTQSEVSALKTAINSGKVEGLVQNVRSSDQNWFNYSGTYIPTSYLTRFFFVAESCAAGGISLGNFLDRVGFSQKLPEADEGQYNVQVVKEISGVSAEQFEEVAGRIKFQIKDNNGNEKELIPDLGDWTQTDEDTYVYSEMCSITIGSDLEAEREVMVTETGYEAPENLKLDATVRNSMDQQILSGTSSTFTVKNKSAVRVDFWNRYSLNTKDLTVIKNWRDYNNVSGLRPEQIELELFYRNEGSTDNWQPYNEFEGSNVIKITGVAENPADPNQWTYTIPGVFGGYEYKIKEKDIASYTGSISSEGNTFTIANTLNWQIVKCSKGDESNVLEGAGFKLSQNGIEIATGSSVSNGVVAWSFNDPDTILDGEYSLIETVAPDNYELSDEVWTLQFNQGLLETVKSGSTDVTLNLEQGKLPTVYFENIMLYELPNSGGPGIYWYLFGGMLLMMTASLMAYKNKRREVLERK